MSCRRLRVVSCQLQGDRYDTMPNVNITEELEELARLQQHICVPTIQLHKMAIEVGGSVPQTLILMLQWAQDHMVSSTSSSHAYAPTTTTEHHRQASALSAHAFTDAPIHWASQTLGLSVLLPKHR